MPRGYVTAPLAKLRTMVPSAYLRVFQPLDGFERSEQLHWERWLVAGRGQTGRPRFADRPTGEGVGFLAPGGREAAEVRAFEGRSDLAQLGELVVELHQWIATFDPKSVLELDYGELSDLMSWDEMDDDQSAEQMQRALDALAKHEPAESAEAYQSVLVRWAEFRS